jgi:hypothetical protein
MVINLDTLVVNKEDNYADLINNKNSDFLWSISFNESTDVSRVKASLYKSNEGIIGVILTNTKLTIFDSKQILTKIESR